jgi:hypothetical protein
MDGLAALPLILSASPASRVVIFTGYERTAVPDVGGTFGLVEKGTPSEELVTMVRSAASEAAA